MARRLVRFKRGDSRPSTVAFVIFGGVVQGHIERSKGGKWRAFRGQFCRGEFSSPLKASRFV